MNWIQLTTQILTGLLSIAGFWKLIEVLIKLPLDKRYRQAEINHLQVDTGTQIIANWEKWTKELKESNEQLKKSNEQLKQSNLQFKQANDELKEIIVQLRSEVSQLQDKVDLYEKHNRQLMRELKKKKENE